MSKIKNINICCNEVDIILFNNVFISREVNDNVFNFFCKYFDKFIGVEIFDMECIDSIIKEYCSSNLLSISKLFLELGALELGCPVYKYVGDFSLVPEIIFDECVVLNIDDLTVTDIINQTFKFSDLVFYSNDLIVCDLAIGLGIHFIKTDNIKVNERIDYLSRMM